MSNEASDLVCPTELKLMEVVRDALTNPRTYAISAIELECMLFALVNSFASTGYRETVLKDSMGRLKGEKETQYGSFCRAKLESYFPEWSECQSEECFESVVSAYSQIAIDLGIVRNHSEITSGKV